MAKKKRRNTLQDIAEANADLRFGPEASSLQALMGQAHEDYKTDVRSANALARTVIQGARKSRPLLRKIYNQAATGVEVAQSDIERAFNQAGVTPDNAFRLASETGTAAYRQKMTAEAASARRETVRQAQEARLGRIFAKGAARDRYNSTVGQLQQRATDLTGERQSFLVSELGRMREERASRRTQENVAQIQQGYNPKTGEPLAGPGATPFEPASRDDKDQLTTALARANDMAPDLRQAGFSREEVATMLREGIAANKKKGRQAFAAVRSQLAVRIALDMAYNGSVSAKTRRELLDAGFRPNELDGVKFYRDKRKRRRVANRYATEGANIVGSSIPGVGEVFGSAL